MSRRNPSKSALRAAAKAFAPAGPRPPKPQPAQPEPTERPEARNAPAPPLRRLALDCIPLDEDPRPTWLRPGHPTKHKGDDLKPQTRQGIADDFAALRRFAESIAPWARNRHAAETGSRDEGRVLIQVDGRAIFDAIPLGDPDQDDTPWQITFERAAFPDIVQLPPQR